VPTRTTLNHSERSLEINRCAHKPTSVFEAVRDLQSKLEVNEREAEMEKVEDEILSMPVVYGSTRFNDSEL
jgi:hypothetical protein